MAERALNLTAFRRELRLAHEEFETSVRDAGERLAKRITAAEEAFTGDYDEPMPAGRDELREYSRA
jgi:hypothetical protein